MMRATSPSANHALHCAHLEASFRLADVRGLATSFEACTPDTASAILSEASRFADEELRPLNAAMDRAGVQLCDGRVQTALGHRAAWDAFVAAGWPTLDHAEAYGGQQLPLALGLAAQELFDRACPAFGMLPVPQRSAARLIAAYGDDTTRAAFLPGLADGSLGATICISEAGAGSDVMQMRSRAVPSDDGSWALTGEKCWISYGDHDLTSRIIHMVLARTDAPGAERPEISLFLVEGDAVIVRRIEDKLGLHGSPTCALGFEAAGARLIGKAGRGLAQMFVMITQMRLAVGAMGLGIASACFDTAMVYAQDRRQGGRPGDPAPIASHRDVQRQLLEMAARTEILRGLILNTANLADIAAYSRDADERTALGAVVQYLLPIVKTFGADAAFANAHGAIQVLGGAGYTRDWPVEQALRDARVLSVFEGTSGIQALDIVHRRVLRDRTGFDGFVALARADAGAAMAACLNLIVDAADRMAAMDLATGDVEAGANAFLELAMLVAGGWVATRFSALPQDDPAHRHMQAAAEYWLAIMPARAALHHAQSLIGSHVLRGFEAIRPG